MAEEACSATNGGRALCSAVTLKHAISLLSLSSKRAQKELVFSLHGEVMFLSRPNVTMALNVAIHSIVLFCVHSVQLVPYVLRRCSTAFVCAHWGINEHGWCSFSFGGAVIVRMV